MPEALLRQEIKEKGPLPQSRFMERAVKTYYRTFQGVGQDFTTAPEVSQVFGESLGLWALDLYQQLGSPKKIRYIELGPGRGTLLADMVRVAKLSQAFSAALDIHLVEISPRLRQLQEQAVAGVSVRWHEKFDDIPPSSTPLIIIANEFFDTFPTTYYLRQKGVVYERCVDLQQDTFEFVLRPLKEEDGPDKVWEESVEMIKCVEEILTCLKKQTGAFLCLDYGYEKGEGETLQALFQGKPSCALENVGESDLSCHVNFGQLREMGLQHAVGVEGPLPQGVFLNNLNIKQRVNQLKQCNPLKAAALEAGYRRLTHPSQMGLLFKALALFFPTTLLPLGFRSHEV